MTVLMLTNDGCEIRCTEAFARELEQKGLAARSAPSVAARSSSTSSRRKASITAEAFAGAGATSEQFAHLEAAIVEGAEAAGHQRTADAIVQAGKVARAGGHELKATGVAAQIIAAGKKARGEKP